MALIPAAVAARTDQTARTICFVMKSGAKLVAVQVTDAALRAVEPFAMYRDAPLETFKRYRKRFERIASHKHDLGRMESDGSIHILPHDVAANSNCSILDFD